MFKRALTLLMFFVLPSISAAQPYINDGCLGNNTDTCFVLIEGEITPGLTQYLEAYVRDVQPEGTKLYLNSAGGNLGEALRLGRAIRDLGWTTSIGGLQGHLRNPDGSLPFAIWDGYPSQGICESACAYAFMGGTGRHMPNDARLGFHRFSAPGRAISGDAAQALSGQLISYIVEMGVDPRVFVLASGEGAQSMYHIAKAEAETFDVVTPSGYEPFSLEPYEAGVIAVAKRADPTSGYDLTEQISAYCISGHPLLTLSASQHNLSGDLRAAFTAVLDDQTYEIPSNLVSVVVDQYAGYITAEIGEPLAKALTSATSVSTEFAFAPVNGGGYQARFELSAADQAKIATAFKFCAG